MDGDVVSAERIIPAPAVPVFGLVADAARHADIDGSGTVRHAKPGALVREGWDVSEDHQRSRSR